MKAFSAMASRLAVIVLGVWATHGDQLTFTLTYDDLNLTNGAALPNPYPGVSAATVIHFGTDQHASPFEQVTFWGGLSPGNGYGNLTNVVLGPRGNPSSVGLIDPAWGFISITPNHPGTFVRLISFDLASLDDNDVDEAAGIYVHDRFPYTYAYWSSSVALGGDVDNTRHTHVVFTNASGNPVEGPVDVGLSIWWESRNGRVAVDNVKFEIVGPVPPVAARHDFYTVPQGGVLSASESGVLANDLLKQSTGPLRAALLSGPTQGTLDFTTNGGFEFVPDTNFAGMDGFVYQAVDQQANLSTGAAIISVLPTNTCFYDDFVRPAGLSVLTPWSVADRVSLTGAVAYGSWTITNGVLEGRSELNSSGHLFVRDQWADYSLEVRARMPEDGFSWSIGGRVDPTTGRRYSVALLPAAGGTSWILRLIKYAGWDAWSGTTLSGQLDVAVPGAGTTNLHALRVVFHGNHIVVYWDGVPRMNVFDNNWERPVYASGGISLGMYTYTNNFVLGVEDVTVSPLNPPVATNLTAGTAEDTPLGLQLLGQAPAGQVAFAIATQPTNGILSGLDASNGFVTYTPATNGNGIDAFRFTVSDGTLLATGTVSLTITPVDDEPVAANLELEIPEDAPTILLLPGSDADGPVTFAILSGPAYGTLSGLNTNNGTVTYMPATNYNGPDAFEFLVQEAGSTATGTVSLVVTPVNDAPTATSFHVTMLEDTPTNLTLLGSDVDSPLSFAILEPPSHGALSGLDSDTGSVRYQPATNFFGSDAFTFSVSDGTMQATGTVTVTVVPVNDAPLAADLFIELLENASVNLQLPGSDPEGTNFFSIAAGPNHGTLANLNTNTGAVSYTPAPGYEGIDTFNFIVNDGALSATGQVKLTVLPVAIGYHGGVEVAGNLALAPDAVRDLAGYQLGPGTNASRFWTHIDAGNARRVIVQGRHAFVAGGTEGLITIDLTDPDLSVAEGHYQTEGTCVDVAVAGDVVYVADLEIGVSVLDVTTPQYPVDVSIAATNETVLGLDVVSNLLYAAAGPAGLLIYDMSNPLKPVRLASCATAGSATRVRAQAGMACVIAGGGTRFEVINVTNAQSPTLIGSYVTAGHVTDLDVADQHAFLAGTNGTIEVLSLTNAAGPQLVSSSTVPGGATGIRVVGNLAYVRDLAGKLVAIELAGFNPMPPRLVRPVEDIISIAGQVVVFTADTRGSAPMSYQWFKNGIPLTDDGRVTGATSAFLKLNDSEKTDEGEYSIRAANAVGQVTSANATLTVVLPGTPVDAGAVAVGGFTAGVWTDGRYAYAAAGSLGLRAFDIANPHFPVAAGSYDTEGDALSVAVVGHHAYVADGAAGVRIVDLINTPVLSPIGGFNTPGTAYGMNVIAGHAYVADGDSGLRILDVSNPRQPAALAGYDTPGTAFSVKLFEGLAYVADGSAGVQILSVTNPANPTLIGTFDTDGTAYRVEVIGNRAYVADGANGLVILDVSNPALPVMLGHYPTAGPVLALVAVDSIAVLAEGLAGVEVVNTSNPADITTIGTASSLGDVRDVKLSGNLIVAACGANGVRMLTLLGIAPDPPEIVSASEDQFLLPGQLATLAMTATGTNPLRYQWFKNGQMLFERAGAHGVITDTLQLTNLTFGDSGDYSLTVWNAWNLPASASVNVQVVPLGTPVPRANYNYETDPLSVRVSGQLGYVASREGGLEIYDFRNAQQPGLLNSHPTMSYAQQVQLRGHVAYVAAWESGLEIFDVSVPTNVVQLGRCDTPGLAQGVFVAGPLAYVADQTNGLQIIDVRNPEQPFLLSSTRTFGPAMAVQVQAGKAYVAASDGGLEILEVSDPLGPIRLGRIDTPGEAVNVEVIGHHAFVSDYDQGFQIIDVSNPAAPTRLGTYSSPGDVFQVQVVSNLAYVAKGVAGLDVVNTGNPLLPSLALAGRAGATVRGVEVSGKHLFLADRASGFVIAELLGLSPASPELVESPANTDAAEGRRLVLSVAVRGTPPFDYQWLKDGVALSTSDGVQGVSEPHLRLSSLISSDAGGYSVMVSNPRGAVTSAVANVTVSAPSPAPVAPAFVVQPVSASSSLGGTVIFQAFASGSAPMSYRWLCNGQPVFDGEHFSGATTPSLVVSNIALRQDGVYQLRAWNNAGVATSLPATLTFVGPLQDEINYAAAGSTIPLPPGIYAEKLVITQHLTLLGAGARFTSLDALGEGTALTVGENAKVTLIGVTIRNGRSPANGMGGGIKNLGSLELQDCELVNNAADIGGGLFNAGDFFATNCTFADNQAVGVFDTGAGIGGGIYSAAGTGWLVNCTISGNVAPAAGSKAGGVFVGSGWLELRASTLAFNYAAAAAGGVLADADSVVRARNTLFAGNEHGMGASDFSGTLDSAGFNFLQATNDALIVGETTSNLLQLNPRLRPLSQNGEGTRAHALVSGSPALDAGACDDPFRDQRGTARPFDVPVAANASGGCDIGAFEYTSDPPFLGVPSPIILEEDSTVAVPFVLGDQETPNGITLVVHSDNDLLLPPSGLVVQGTGTNRSLVIAAATNQFGTAALHFRVTDADGLTNGVSVPVFVQPVNDAPVARDLMVSLLEDTTNPVTLHGSDLEGPVLFAILNGPSHGTWLDFDPDAGTLSYRPSINFHGPDAFTYLVSDGSLQATGTVMITVLPVNDAPVISGLVDQVVEGHLSEYQFGFTLTDVDSEVDVITLQLGSTNPTVIDPGTITVSGERANWLLHLPHVPGNVGVTTISVVASDGVAIVTNRFRLEVQPIALSLVGLTISNKTYDGGTAASISSYGALSGVLPGDDVSLDVSTALARFRDKQAAIGKVVTVSGINLIGPDAGSYTLNPIQTASASILARPLAASPSAANKVYDGTMNALVTWNDDRVVGDLLNVFHSAASFADKYAGLGKTVTVSGIALAGPDAPNYWLAATTMNASADISKAPLIATADDQIRAYGLTNPVLTISYRGFVGGDTAGDLDSPPVASTMADGASLVGEYPITLAGGADGDYEFILVDGALLIVDAPLKITGVVLTNGVAVITWSATASRTYRVEYKQDWSDEFWTGLTPDLVATGPAASITDPEGSASRRFYRVMLVPSSTRPNPAITSITVAQGMAILTWTAQAGSTYRLQYKRELTDSNWVDSGFDILTSGPTAVATNLVGNATHRFYRVMIVHPH